MQEESKFEDIPEVPFIDFIFKDFDEKIVNFKEKPWIVDIPSGRSVTFGQVKVDATKIASGLARRGFKQRDIIYFVTYEVAQLFLVKVAVWMLGGVVRGCSQKETPDVYAKEIKESAANFILVDSDTIHGIHPALEMLHFEGCLISLGDEPIPGTSHISKLLIDDGSAFKPPSNINVKEDAVVIINTSGSTGIPKGVVHTQYSMVAIMMNLRNIKFEDSMLEFMVNYGVGIFMIVMNNLNSGRTLYHVSKFERETYFDQLLTYKPQSILFYPYVANWFARCDDHLAKLRSANFLKSILVGGWVLDPATGDFLIEKLPNTHLLQIYGMTEIGFSTSTKMGEKPAKLERYVCEGQVVTSSGIFLPRFQAKIVNVENKNVLGPHEAGEVFVKSPSNAKGYLISGKLVAKLTDDKDGWFPTGDIGFMDEKGNLYIKDRAKFIYKYMADFVAPTEIEATLQEHPGVQEAGVVGIPDPATNNISRAFVVLKPGKKCSERELCKFVADRLAIHKQLHGGVRFVQKLPVNKAGKLDRKALKELALSS